MTKPSETGGNHTMPVIPVGKEEIGRRELFRRAAIAGVDLGATGSALHAQTAAAQEADAPSSRCLRL